MWHGYSKTLKALLECLGEDYLPMAIPISVSPKVQRQESKVCSIQSESRPRVPKSSQEIRAEITGTKNIKNGPESDLIPVFRVARFVHIMVKFD